MVALGAVTERDLVISQRGKFQLTVQVSGAPASWSGWSAKMQIRPHRGSLDLLDQYETGSEITFVAGGQVQIDVPGASTATYTWTKAVYDLYVIDATNEPYRILQGDVTVDHSVTIP